MRKIFKFVLQQNIMGDIYRGEWNSSNNGNNHVVDRTSDEEFYYCKCEGCKLGVYEEDFSNEEEAIEALNELDCPADSEEIKKISRAEFNNLEIK